MQKIKQINLSRELTHQSLARNQSHAFPVEILARIFTFYRSEALQAPDNPFLRILYPSWIDITHVCHHWRAVALNHGQLWSSVTRGLPLPWIKTFMERSGTMLMDFDIYVTAQCRDTGACLHHEDIVPLLAHFTRVRSLCLTGSCNDIFPIVDSLRKSLPVQTLSLCLEDNMSDFILPDDLFGGEAPIRRLQLVGDHILVPRWLLHGVTHFTFTPTMSPSPELFNTLRHMSMLTYFEFRPRRTSCYSGESFTTGASPIQMPQLVNLIVGAYCAHDFILLNQALLLHVDAKRRLELRPSCYNFLASNWHSIDGLSPIVEAVNGFQHIQFSGAQNHPRFLLWSGDVGTTWEDATLCLSVEWNDREHQRIELNPLIGFCTQIGAARVRRLVVESSSSGLPKSYWWKVLHCFPGVEELELYPAGADILGDAWRINLAPAVLPALRRVQIHSELDHPSPLYTIIGDPPARRIVALSSSTEDGASAEQEIENISKGLLRLVRGLGRNPKKGKRKGRGARG